MSTESHELEREAIDFTRKYRFFIGPALPFLRRLALFLNWQELQRELEK
jgi:hypothetical protein